MLIIYCGVAKANWCQLRSIIGTSAAQADYGHALNFERMPSLPTCLAAKE